MRGELSEVETDAARLRSASFLDGREMFWSSQRLRPLDLGCTLPAPGARFIFHVGFCGSTLLARLIDRPGSTLVLKEPQCLADLAGQRAKLVAGEGVAPLGPLIDFTLQRLDNVSTDLVVIKPTNWANAILPQLCARERNIRAVFVSIDRRAYLGAVFRGGRERLAFSARLAAAIAPVVPGAEEMLGSAAAAAIDPLDKMARITALLHAMQEALFERARVANGWTRNVMLDFAELTDDPVAVLPRVHAALGLAAPGDDPARIAAVMGRHTKSPQHAFAPESRHREDREIERLHGARFDAALEWLAGLDLK